MLSIGMALMTKPKLLLLDEPLLGLSPAMQNSLIQAIKQIRKEGITDFSGRTVCKASSAHCGPWLCHRKWNAHLAGLGSGAQREP